MAEMWIPSNNQGCKQPIYDRSGVNIWRMRVLFGCHVVFRIKVCSLQHTVYQSILLCTDMAACKVFLLSLSLATTQMFPTNAPQTQFYSYISKFASVETQTQNSVQLPNLMGRTVRGSNLGGGVIFPTHPDRPNQLELLCWRHVYC
jgi:hypothetical protein